MSMSDGKNETAVCGGCVCKPVPFQIFNENIHKMLAAFL